MLLASTLSVIAATGVIGQTAAKPAADAKPAAPVGYKNTDVEKFDKMRAEKNTVVLDVRTADEFKTGHIPGAINLDVRATDFKEKVAKLDKSKIYLVHCAAGSRSVTACNAMAPLQFANLFNLEGGFSAWSKAGKPVEK